MNRTLNSRNGVVVIPIIAFYAVAMTLIAVWAKSSMRDRRQVVLWHEHTQTSQLAEAGMRKALARLDLSGGSYEGEKWQIPSQELGLPQDAQIEIRITEIEQSTQDDAETSSGQIGRRILVVAEYPAGQNRRNRVTKELVLVTNTK